MRLFRIVAVLSVLAAVLVADAAAFNVRPNQSPPSGLVGQPYSYQVEASAGCKPYEFSQGSGGLPPGLSLSSSGLISGTPTQPGTWGFWIKAKERCIGQTSEASMSISIGQKLTATSTSPLPFGIVGTGYGQKLAASGPGQFTWSVVGGTLPPGLTLAADGTLAGTPTTAGSYSFVPKVSNGSQEDTLSSGLLVEIVQPLTLALPTTTPAVAGAPFAAKLAATGGKPPYVFSFAAGTPPPGLLLNPTTGELTGTPESPGTYSLSLAVKDALGQSKSVPLPLTIVRPLEAVTARLPLAKMNVPYRGKLVSLGGALPVRWELVDGFLPRGVRLAPKNGLLVGKPRVAGTFEVSLQVTDKLGGSALQDLTLTVRAPKIVVIRRALNLGRVGKAYIGRIWARGGMAPRDFEIVRGALPKGVTLNPANGQLRGKPTKAGKARFTVRVTDALGNKAARYFVLRVRT